MITFYDFVFFVIFGSIVLFVLRCWEKKLNERIESLNKEKERLLKERDDLKNEK